MRPNFNDEVKVRISGGILKGSNLFSTDTQDLRPTPVRVREAVFSMMSSFSETHAFVDLYSGSGAMAFEALSRGFLPVALAEMNLKARNAISSNCARLHVEFDILHSDAEALLGLLTSYYKGICVSEINQGDWEKPILFYLDPPYRIFQALPEILGKIAEFQRWPEGSVCLVEHEKGKQISALPGLTCLKQKQYGNTWLTLFSIG